ncbi:MAG: methylated-DNA--[protein]-cysteine S-methyltransferase [Filimonas sp.]|nr:methylated-DNA--[protein]-cysteine S-methyltransferase [Filimonas sp.]
MSNYQRIAEAIQYIRTNFKEQPSLDDIAANVHLSPFHFQRMFTEWAGVSPKKFLQYLTVSYAKDILKESKATVFDASFEAGLSGTSRLHDLFVSIEGMTPGDYKNGGAALTIHYNIYDSPFGAYLLASTSKGICTLFFYDDKNIAIAQLKQEWPNATFIQQGDTYHEAIQSFFQQGNKPEQIKLHLKGTDFQLKVWEALLKIPEGALVDYSGIAKQIGKAQASRAVGTAIGNNPVGYIIPCHRVIKNVGVIGEYRWGTTRKMAMIGWEAGQMENAAS